MEALQTLHGLVQGLPEFRDIQDLEDALNGYRFGIKPEKETVFDAASGFCRKAVSGIPPADLQVSASSGEELSDLLSKFTRDTNNAQSLSLWPLVKSIRYAIYRFCSDGVNKPANSNRFGVLNRKLLERVSIFDLPGNVIRYHHLFLADMEIQGENDTNSLRSDTARKIEQTCDAAIIVTKVDRCTTNGSLKMRLEELSRKNFQSIMLACTFADVRVLTCAQEQLLLTFLNSLMQSSRRNFACTAKMSPGSRTFSDRRRRPAGLRTLRSQIYSRKSASKLPRRPSISLHIY